jgi:hypothetical protein
VGWGWGLVRVLVGGFAFFGVLFRRRSWPPLDLAQAPAKKARKWEAERV